MKKILLFLISLFIGLGLFFWIGEMIGWQEIKNAFLVFTHAQGLAILILTLLMLLIGTWRWKEILKSLGVDIPFSTLLRPYWIGFSLAYLFPIMILGREITCGYFLKKRDFASWPKAMGSIIIDRILEWTVNLIIIFLGVGFFLSKIGLPQKDLGIILGVIFLFFIFLIFFFYFKAFKKESIVKSFLGMNNGRALEAEKEIFAFFHPQKKAMWKGFGLSFLRGIAMFTRTWLLIMYLGKSLGVLPALSVLGFSCLAAMIPIPTALGSHELIQIFAFNNLGFQTASAAAFTMIIRGAELMIAFIGILILFQTGMGLLKKILMKKLNNSNNCCDVQINQ